MSTDQVIHLEKVNKWYDDFHVLKDIDLNVNKAVSYTHLPLTTICSV